MYPTLLDTKTGKRVIAKGMDYSLFWWTEGNGSCDCNRAIAIGNDVENEMTIEFGAGCCFGNSRIVAIDVHGDLEGISKEQILREMNDEYPETLKEKKHDKNL